MMARHRDMGPSSCVHQQFPANQCGVESAETGSSFPLPHTSQVVQSCPLPHLLSASTAPTQAMQPRQVPLTIDTSTAQEEPQAPLHGMG